MSKTNKTIIVILAALTINLLLFFLIISYKPTFRFTNYVLNNTKRIGYELSPINSYLEELQRPLAMVAGNLEPKDIRYPLINLAEFIKIKMKINDEIFFAVKRINELEAWVSKPSLPIIGNLAGPGQLQKWWNKVFHPTNYGSWEALLARYYQLMDKTITQASKDKNNQNRLQQVKIIDSYLRSHQERVHNQIFRLESPDDKKYLTLLTKNLFKDLGEKNSRLLPVFKPGFLVYDNQPVIEEKQYGLYNIYLEKPSNPDQIKGTPAITVDGKQYVSELDPIDNTVFVFRNIPINKKTKNVYLSFSPQNLVEEGEWQETDRSDDLSRNYFLNVKNIPTLQPLLLDYTYQFDSTVNFTLAASQSGVLISRIMPTDDQPYLWQQILSYPKTPSISSPKFTLSSKNVISEKSLKYKPNLFALFEPTIALEKVDYLLESELNITSKKIKNDLYEITVKNTTKNDDAAIKQRLDFGWKIKTQINFHDYYILIVEYWPKKLLVIASLLSLMILSVLLYLTIVFKNPKKIFTQTSQSFKLKIAGLSTDYFNILKNISKKLSAFSQRRKLFFLLLVIIVIIGDILLKRVTSDLSVFIIILCFLVITYGYRVNSAIYLTAGLFFFIFTPIFQSFKLYLLAEKVTLWSYVFMLFGIFQAIMGLLMGQNINKIMDFTQIVSFQKRITESIKPVISPLLIKAEKIIKSIMNWIKKNWKRYINQKPKKISDYLANGVKICILSTMLVFFICLVVTITVAANRKITAWQRLQIRLSKDPKIIKYQPTIVYHNTKVLIRGKSFSWKQNEKVVLKTDRGEINTDYWADDKIVFTVPIDWKPGLINLWIEKPVEWEGKRSISKSKIIQLKLIPISASFTAEDDAYFKQLKHLDKEVLKLNGYE